MRGFMNISTLCLSLGLASLPLQAGVINATDQSHLTLTLYNQDLAMIQDQRRLPALSPGQRISVEDVSRQMLPETLRIQGAGQILEQSLLQNPLNYNALLQAHLGKFIQVARINQATGHETISTVELLSIDQQALVRRDGRIESIPMNSSEWRFIFPSELPDSLKGRAGLEFVSAGTTAEGTAQLNYLSRGLGWQMDYVLTLDSRGKSLAAEGLASVYNRSGSIFQDADLRLMAGDINVPSQAHPEMMRAMAMSDTLGSQAESPEQMQDFYLYRLPYPVTLQQNETKQLPLVQFDDIPAKMTYRHHFNLWPAMDQQRHKSQPEVQLVFEAPSLDSSNSPMPAGQARVFRPDREGELQFIGAAQLSNLAAGEEAVMSLGRAFDLNITRRQTLFSDGFDKVTMQQEISITNSGNEGRSVDLSAGFQQAWELKESSHPMKEDGAGQLTWSMHLPAGGTETMRFTVEMKKRINR